MTTGIIKVSLDLSPIRADVNLLVLVTIWQFSK